MTGPTMAEPKSKKTSASDIGIVPLQENVIRDRAIKAFDRVAKQFLNVQVKALNADLAKLKDMVMADQKKLPPNASGQRRFNALEATIKNYCAKNKDSVLSSYIIAGLDRNYTHILHSDPEKGFSYSYEGRKVTVKVSFDVAGAKQWLKGVSIDRYKESAINEIVKACKPTEGSKFERRQAFLFGVSETGEAVYVAPTMAKQFAEKLMKELGIGKNKTVPPGHLPISIKYSDNPNLARAEVPMHPTPALEFSYAGVKKVEKTKM